jgi:predicted nucleic-acid-binding Zn-ribbon protein
MANEEVGERERLRSKYQDTIDRLWTKSRQCPICRTDNWNVADLVDVTIRGIAPAQAYVYVPVGCTNCGYTMFFHSGILDQRSSQLSSLRRS